MPGGCSLKTGKVYFVEGRGIVLFLEEHDHVHGSVEDFPFLSQIAVVEYDGFFLRIFAAVQDVGECPVDFIVFAGFDFYRQDSAGQLYDEVQFTALLVVV